MPDVSFLYGVGYNGIASLIVSQSRDVNMISFPATAMGAGRGPVESNGKYSRRSPLVLRGATHMSSSRFGITTRSVMWPMTSSARMKTGCL